MKTISVFDVQEIPKLFRSYILFYLQQLYNQNKTEIGKKKLAKTKQHPQVEL